MIRSHLRLVLALVAVPALLAGNVIVFKPSEKTPAVGERLVSYFQAAGSRNATTISFHFISLMEANSSSYSSTFSILWK